MGFHVNFLTLRRPRYFNSHRQAASKRARSPEAKARTRSVQVYDGPALFPPVRQPGTLPRPDHNNAIPMSQGNVGREPLPKKTPPISVLSPEKQGGSCAHSLMYSIFHLFFHVFTVSLSLNEDNMDSQAHRHLGLLAPLQSSVSRVTSRAPTKRESSQVKCLREPRARRNRAPGGLVQERLRVRRRPDLHSESLCGGQPRLLLVSVDCVRPVHKTSRLLQRCGQTRWNA